MSQSQNPPIIGIMLVALLGGLLIGLAVGVRTESWLNGLLAYMLSGSIGLVYTAFCCAAPSDDSDDEPEVRDHE